MKRITLHIYNYGIKTKIADFKNNSMDAVKCMKFLNDDEIRIHGKLPENIFYYLDYTMALNKKRSIFVDFTGSNLCPNEIRICAKIDGVAEKLYA